MIVSASMVMLACGLAVLVPTLWHLLGLLSKRPSRRIRRGYDYIHTPTGKVRVRKGGTVPHTHLYGG